ncbi:MAG: hypothetical protein ACUVRM_07840 [Bacillota bacterium]
MSLAFYGNMSEHCPRYIDNHQNDMEKLNKIAELWLRVGWRDRLLPPEELACHGCDTAKWCRYGIRECALARDAFSDPGGIDTSLTAIGQPIAPAGTHLAEERDDKK